MATQVQWRRGTASQVAAFTGAAGEVVINTTDNRLVVQDGTTMGGWPAAKQSGDTFTNVQGITMGAGAAITLPATSKITSTGGVYNAAQATVASASTVDLFGQAGDSVTISGTTTITSFGSSLGSAAGAERSVIFSGSMTLTYNATSMILPGSTNIVTQAGDTCRVRYLGSGNSQVIEYTRATGVPLYFGGAGTNGYISGFTLSNDSGSPNTVIDVAIGVAADSTSAIVIDLTSPATVNFATTGAGGLDTGSIASTSWYAIFVIYGTAGASVIATKETAGTPPSPTLPTGYTYKRYIGSVPTDGSAHLLAFTQRGQNFMRKASVTDVSTSSPPNTDTLFTTSSPLGVITFPIERIVISSTTVQTVFLDSVDQIGVQSIVAINQVNGASASTTSISCNTNLSAQLYYGCSTTSATVNIINVGWIDPHVASVW